MKDILLYTVFAAFNIFGVSAFDENFKVEIGDYRTCLKQLDKAANSFEVLPIYGWDNLRNVETGIVIALNYSKCKLSADGKYLMPDDVYLIPNKKSKLQEFAELITHWHNYTSLTSKSINVGGGLSFHSFGISGKYSDSYQTSKTKQVMDKSYVTRVQLRYIGYTAKLEPDAQLHPKFKSSLFGVGSSLQMNRTEEARYRSDMIVRDFGTHVVTSADAGAALVQEDYVSKEFILKEEMHKHEIMSSASASLFKVVNFSFRKSSSSTDKMADSYEKSKTSSNLLTFGGSIASFSNISTSNWVTTLDDNLVAMDRSGDPLYYMVNRETLPELPLTITEQVRDHLKHAIERYYAYNVHRGCMNMESPNFSFQSNVDDGSCKPPLSNLTFGGVYQLCQMSPGSNAGDLCRNYSQPNPKTGKFECPPNYKSTKLHTEVFRRRVPYRECHDCGWWSTCCSSGVRSSTATLSIYWCAATGKVPANSGYLFGGIYSSNVENPVTNDKSCPVAFSSRMMGSDLKVCISDDYEEGGIGSLPFGGFFSCDSGNPLAEDDKKSIKSDNGPLFTLKEYYRKTGAYTGPKSCPKGFSQHLALIDQECSIYFCVAAGILSPKSLPQIRRPPFCKRPTDVPRNEEIFVYSMSNETWMKGFDAQQWLKRGSAVTPSSIEPGDNANSLSPSATAAIAVCVTVAVTGMVIMLILVIWQRRKRATVTSEDRERLIGGQNYGATTSGQNQ